MRPTESEDAGRGNCRSAELRGRFLDVPRQPARVSITGLYLHSLASEGMRTEACQKHTGMVCERHVGSRPSLHGHSTLREGEKRWVILRITTRSITSSSQPPT
jgi:hypothetical protein